MANDNKKACGDGACTRQSCEGCPKSTEGFMKKAHELSNIGKVIGVVSGKGGVGKSLVTAMLSVLFNRKGYKTGILDADITGPSIPNMFGIHDKAESDALGIYPRLSKGNIKIMSINLLLENPAQPVIWRGPILAGAVKQFWTDVIWGDLDVLFIDMPPGTGDVPLTVFQSIPISGIVIVTSPQELVSMIVKKAYNMAKQMNIPVLGVVENYSYVKCPHCDKIIELFGKSKIESVAKELNIKVLGNIPIDPRLAELSDSGEFEKFDNNSLYSAATELEKIIKG